MSRTIKQPSRWNNKPTQAKSKCCSGKAKCYICQRIIEYKNRRQTPLEAF